MIDTQTALGRCQDLLDIAKRFGADRADAMARASSSESVGVRLGALEDVERSESEEVALRVFVGQRTASIVTSDFSPESFAALAERAVEMARLAPEDPYVGFAPEDQLFTGDMPDLELGDTAEPTPAHLREAALAIEDAGRAVAGVSNSNGGNAVFSRSVAALATSHGFARGYAGSAHSRSAAMIAGEGGSMQTDYAHRTARYAEDLPDAAEIGREAGERTVARLNPGSLPSGKMPLVFDPRIGNGLIGHLLGAMNGGAIARKSSFLLGRENDALFDSALRLEEDPLRPRGQRSRPFDGEGVTCTPRALVENGRIFGWMTNVASARQLDLALTGHASRGGGGAPGVGASNVHLMAGTVDPEALMADIADGLYVSGVFGQGVNLVTGDYSRGAHGFRIRNGQLAEPVAEITIAGNLIDMFAAMIPANDLEFHHAVNVPSLRIDGMTVAGE
ncbi:TldD/PmbA family protein [Qipengyuania marisflavi]|uniref:TldD/PmbA family protein n=1 Tax=Qipengyuania marisflavi TaxID=2486356 RepID=A0A5S3P1P4_9SPHN|nr:metallopeptidase TldD-related protein [Qipengyuania marisflavi]TMM46615.1 TldD/PmbA family protein [Qipengyuania marisflavi]